MAKATSKVTLRKRWTEHQSLWKQLYAFQQEHFGLSVASESKYFCDQHVSGTSLVNAFFETFIFERCSFDQVKFQNCEFSNCEFIDCTFTHCDFSFTDFFNVLFKDTKFFGGILAESTCSDVQFENVRFQNCRDVLEIRFGGCTYLKLTFSGCQLGYLTFDNKLERQDNRMNFEGCHLSHSAFYWYKLQPDTFTDTDISHCTFNNCQIGAGSISSNNTTTEGEFNTLDFQTILKSDIPSLLLSKHFGIHSPYLKLYVMEMVSKVDLHTVFISYSFIDKAFASRLNSALRARGVMTFLWEKDAPAGERLKTIMAHNVNKFDKVLFIASEHSLKSEACHYELTNGRKKQDKIWDLVLFPIHIDPFLFSVEEHQIPRVHRAEFWTNILELREINSMDFSAFTCETRDSLTFDEQVDKLIKGLRKER